MLMALAFLLLFLVLLGMAFRHPVWGVYAYLAAFFVHPPSRWWGASLPDLRWVFLAAVVTLIAVLVHRRRGAQRPSWLSAAPTLIVLAYCLWMWLQSFWAIDSVAHGDAVVQYTKYLVVGYLMYQASDSVERVQQQILAVVLGCALLGVMALYSTNFVDGRLNGVGGPGIDDANSLGMMLAAGAVAGSMLLLSGGRWTKIAALCAMPFIVNGMILAGSRGSFLGALVGGAVVFLLRPKESARMFWMLAIVGLAGAVSLVDQRFIDRMLTIRTAFENVEEADTSSQSRAVLKEAQWKMFADQPFGSGHKGTLALSWRYLDERWLATDENGNRIGRSSHNTFMTTLVEQGVIGATLYLSLVGWWAVTVLRVWRTRGSAAWGAPVAPMGAMLGALGVVFTAGNFTDYLMAEVQFWYIALIVAYLRLAAVTKTAPAAVPAAVAVPRNLAVK
jgi:O-Antigen ligase